MNNKIASLAACLFAMTGSVHAATDWSADQYDLYPGDFDGDGKTDMLYVAKDASRASGIARSDGSGPNIAWQSWPSNYLGIPWHGNTYAVVVADFNGDGRADLLLQKKTAGDHYLLFADATGKFVGIGQTIANGALGLDWSGAEHRIHAGRISGDSRADLFFQATKPTGTHAVVMASASGEFTAGPYQTWTDASWSAFRWSTVHSNIYLADFNGDGRADLLVQAKPKFVTVDFEVPFPVPTFAPNSFGVVLAQIATPYQQVGVQQWSRHAHGVDWSPLATDVIVGNFDGTGGADVLLQARSPGRPSYLIPGNSSGAVFTTSTALAANVSWASSGARLLTGNFDGTGAEGVYFQAQTAAGTNYIAAVVTGSSVTQTPHNPSSATGVLPTTAVGHTAGTFGVSNAGSAGYSIPILVPPGIAGIQPQLSIEYDSSAGNGQLGIGWALDGLSAIERCAKSRIQDGSMDGVQLSTSDRFCLDGNRLRSTGGTTYGAPESTYQTEIESFAIVTAKGAAGNGPAYFVVEAKDGMRMEYGNSDSSRIEAVNATGATTTPHTWALNKVSDPHGNTMTITYEEDGLPNASFRPAEISYTANPDASVTGAYKVTFVWEARPATDYPFTFIAGSATKETKRLARIDTSYNEPGSGWRVVRSYRLGYNTSGSTPRSRLSAVQECAGGGACLAPTTISWYDGKKGWKDGSSSYVISSSAVMAAAHAIDVNGDAMTDLIYPRTSGSSSAHWYAMVTSGGAYALPVGSSHSIDSSAAALPIDYSMTGRQGLLTKISGDANLAILQWNPATAALDKIPTNLSGSISGNEWVGDFDGDGRDDFMYVTVTGTTSTFYLRSNSGMSGGVAQFAAPVSFHVVTTFGTPTFEWNSRTAHADFNADGKTDLLLRDAFHDCEPGQGCVNHTTWKVLLSSGTGFTQQAAWTCETNPCGTTPPLLGDFNGDGYTDIIGLSGNVSSKNYIIRYGHSRGTSSGGTIASMGTLGSTHLAADYDNDGRVDLMYVDTATSTWSVLRSKESGFEPAIATNIPSTGVAGSYRAIDLDGDGQTDIGYQDTYWKVRHHQGPVGDFVKSITDGFGSSVVIEYAPMMDSSVYTKGTGTTLPQVDIVAPIHLVKKYTSTDGIGGTFSVSEHYSGARANIDGYGYLGFEKRTTTDSRTGIKSVQKFVQTFPHIGALDEQSIYQPNGTTLMSFVKNTHAILVTSATAFNERRLPYVQTSVATSYEVEGMGNGLPIAEVTTTTTLDSYGNATNVSTTTVDKTTPALTYTSVVDNTYATSDAHCWWRGFMTRQQLTRTVPGQPTLTRTVDFVKDSTKPQACRLYQEVVEPANPAVRVTTTIGYDTFGHPNTQTVTANGIAPRTSSVSYGPAGVFPESETDAAGLTSSRTFDYGLGVPKTATSPNNISATFHYDDFGRATREEFADNTEARYYYSACTALNGYCGDSRLRYQIETQLLDANDAVITLSRTLHDALGRTIYSQSQTASGAFSNVAVNYDNLGRAYQQSQPYFSGFPLHYTTVLYDLAGRPKEESRRISEAQSGTQTTLYRYNRLLQEVTDAEGKVTKQELNALGQVVKMTDALNGVTTYQYDAFGNLLNTTDVAGSQIVNTYNIRGHKLTTQDPDMGYWVYTYYPTGELWTQTDAKSQVTTFTYDAASKPLTRVEPEGTTQFIYGTDVAVEKNNGKLRTVSSPGGYSELYSYDSFGRPREVTVTADGSSYVTTQSYHATNGLVETITYPASTSAVPNSRLKVKYEYEYGQLKRTRDFHNPSLIYWEHVASNAAGQVIDEALGNGLRTYATFDGITGLPSSIVTGATGQVQNLGYQWDKVGNLTQRRDVARNLTENFEYDNLYRLERSTLVNSGGTSTNLDPTYNARGNITALTRDGAPNAYDYTTPQSACSSQTHTHLQPHAVRRVGTTSYCYDPNGNMTKKGGSDITWYSYNLPSRIDSGANYSQFYYGADRSRYKQVAFTAAAGSQPAKTETTIYIGGLFEKVSRNTGPVEFKHYIVGGTGVVAQRTLRSDSTEETAYLHRDHLGSVDTLTSSAGAILGNLSFDAFGKRRDETDWSGPPTPASLSAAGAITRRGFTGHETLDNVDLVHMNGRVYDPTIGRFVQADPFIQAPLMSQSFNRYSYVINNPLSLTDPSGFSWVSDHHRRMRKHLRATIKFLAFPSPRNFFEHVKAMPGQKSIDRYIMTHDWAYKAGYVVAVVSSWWIGGYGGAVYQAYYTYLHTGSATEAVKVGARVAAMQFAANFVVNLCTSICTNGAAASTAASNPWIVFMDTVKASVGNVGNLGAATATAAIFAPSGPDGKKSAVGGAGVGQTIINSTVPGAYYYGQAELAFREGNYGLGVAHSVASVLEAGIGVFTFGRSTSALSATRAVVLTRGATTASSTAFRILEQEGNVIIGSFNGAAGEARVITELVRQGDTLILRGTHIEGAGTLREALSVARQFGRDQGVKRVIIEGGRRSTGANPGHIPRPITVETSL